MYLRLSVAIALFMALSSCKHVNDNPPEYIKDIVVYQEGSDAFAMYFVLADFNGAMTTADGDVILTITETHYVYNFAINDFVEVPETLYSKRFKVSKKQFQDTTAGLGAFKHHVILYYVGRIPYSLFKHYPTEHDGTATIEFKTIDGHWLKGHTTIFF